MMTFKKKDRKRGYKNTLLVIIGIVVVAAGGWLLVPHMEGTPPEIEIDLNSTALPAHTVINGLVSDSGSGLSRLWAGLIQDGKETVLLEKNFIRTKESPFRIAIDTRQLGIADGAARFRIAAWDRSWRHWGKGNRIYIEKQVVFDSKPPVIDILSKVHNLVPGGAGLVIYRLSESCSTSGVVVGDQFFPGYAGGFNDPEVYMAYFALGYDQGPGTELYVKAVDAAGNFARAGFYHHIREKTFRKDTISLSDEFLSSVVPEFYSEDGFPASAPLKDQFLFINDTLRGKNNEAILENGRKTEAVRYWSGAFLRLPHSAPRAGFADHRDYRYKGDLIDRAVHLGIDLASVRHAKVPAANRGKVVFAGRAGIYGNLVCIDHGFGLFSIYGHLSRIGVEPGRMVEKGEGIGITGDTGLAGGDHLHFGMFVDHVFVNPREWWDAQWIKNNITSKINAVKAQLQQQAP